VQEGALINQRSLNSSIYLRLKEVLRFSRTHATPQAAHGFTGTRQNDSIPTAPRVHLGNIG